MNDKTKDDNRWKEKEAIIDSREPISATEPEVYPGIPDNDIGYAVGRKSSDENRTKFLNLWRPTSTSDFPTSVGNSDNISKRGTKRR